MKMHVAVAVAVAKAVVQHYYPKWRPKWRLFDYNGHYKNNKLHTVQLI